MKYEKAICVLVIATAVLFYRAFAGAVEVLPTPKTAEITFSFDEPTRAALGSAAKRLGYNEEDLVRELVHLANKFSKEQSTAHLVVWDGKLDTMKPIFIRRQDTRDIEAARRRFAKVIEDAKRRAIDRRKKKENRDE